MKATSYYFSVIFAALCSCVYAGEDEFYLTFLSLADTNNPIPTSIKSPLPVSTHHG